MADCDLEVMQDRVNRSREEFLHALNDYDANVAKQIIEEFVSIFLDEKESGWATNTRDLANQVIDQDRRFGGMLASITEKVAIASLKMQQTVLHITVELIGSATRVFGTPVATGTSPIELLRARMDQFHKGHRDLIAAGEDATNQTCKVGVHLNRVQRLATDLLLLRIETLNAFKSKNLGVNFQDIINRLREQGKEYATDKGIDEAGRIIAERLQEILGILVKEAPIVRILNVAYKIAKVLGPKDVKPDATNELNKLIDLMKKENAVYQALNDAYNAALEELDQIMKTPLKQAS